MHRSRRMGSTCRSLNKNYRQRFGFGLQSWFLKDLALFLGKVFHHYRYFFYWFFRNVIKPSGRAYIASCSWLHVSHVPGKSESELIWCLNVLCFFRRSLIQNYFPHKMYRKRIDLVLRCNKLPQLMVDSKYFPHNAQTICIKSVFPFSEHVEASLEEGICWAL